MAHPVQHHLGHRLLAPHGLAGGLVVDRLGHAVQRRARCRRRRPSARRAASGRIGRPAKGRRLLIAWAASSRRSAGMPRSGTWRRSRLAQPERAAPEVGVGAGRDRAAGRARARRVEAGRSALNRAGRRGRAAASTPRVGRRQAAAPARRRQRRERQTIARPARSQCRTACGSSRLPCLEPDVPGGRALSITRARVGRQPGQNLEQARAGHGARRLSLISSGCAIAASAPILAPCRSKPAGSVPETGCRMTPSDWPLRLRSAPRAASLASRPDHARRPGRRGADPRRAAGLRQRHRPVGDLFPGLILATLYAGPRWGWASLVGRDAGRLLRPHGGRRRRYRATR